MDPGFGRLATESYLEEHTQLSARFGDIDDDDVDNESYIFNNTYDSYNDYFGHLYLLCISIFTSCDALMSIILCFVIITDIQPYIDHIPWYPIVMIQILGICIFIIYFMYYFCFKSNQIHNNKLSIFLAFLMNYLIITPLPIISNCYWFTLGQTIKKRYKRIQQQQQLYSEDEATPFPQILLWALYRFITASTSKWDMEYRLTAIYIYFTRQRSSFLQKIPKNNDNENIIESLILYESHQFKFHCIIILFTQCIILRILTQLLPIFLSHHVYGFNAVIMVVFTFWDYACIMGFIWFYRKFNWSMLLWIDHMIARYQDVIQYLFTKPNRQIYDELMGYYEYKICERYLYQLFTDHIAWIILQYIAINENTYVNMKVSVTEA